MKKCRSDKEKCIIYGERAKEKREKSARFHEISKGKDEASGESLRETEAAAGSSAMMGFSIMDEPFLFLARFIYTAAAAAAADTQKRRGSADRKPAERNLQQHRNIGERYRR